MAVPGASEGGWRGFQQARADGGAGEEVAGAILGGKQRRDVRAEIRVGGAG